MWLLNKEFKQVILVRTDLKLPKGKMASQVAHASVECVMKASGPKIRLWRSQGMKKVVLKVKDLKELKNYIREAKKHKLVTCLITDAGLTTVQPGTVTAGGIGPDTDEKIDSVTADLKMM